MGEFLPCTGVLRESPEIRRHSHLWPDLPQLRLPHHETTADGQVHRRAGQDAAREENTRHHPLPKVSFNFFPSSATKYVFVLSLSLSLSQCEGFSVSWRMRFTTPTLQSGGKTSTRLQRLSQLPVQPAPPSPPPTPLLDPVPFQLVPVLFQLAQVSTNLSSFGFYIDVPMLHQSSMVLRRHSVPGISPSHLLPLAAILCHLPGNQYSHHHKFQG